MIPTLTIFRGPSTDLGTISGARFESDTTSFELQTIELPDRGNQPQISRIPPGQYETRIVPSEHFHRNLFLLLDVPGRSDVEIHPANWAGDRAKGYHSDLRGCIAPGLGKALMKTPEGFMQLGISGTVVAFNRIMDGCGGKPILVEILEIGSGPDETATA